MRLTVAKIIGDELKDLKMGFPLVSLERSIELQSFIDIIEGQNKL